MHELQPVKIRANERRGGGGPPERERTFLQFIDDTVSALSERWRRHARGLVDYAIQDLDLLRPEAADNPIYRRLDQALTTIRDDIVNGGINGVRRAFAAQAALSGYEGASPADKSRKIRQLAGPEIK